MIDPDLVTVSIPGRLLFIYSWTIADDAGNFERNPRGMKMALFPCDNAMTAARISKLTETLIAGRFYEPYEVAGKQYLHVRSFGKYQHPERPTAPKFPLYPGQEYTYQVKEGSTWIKKTVVGGFGEPSPKTHRRDAVMSPSILAGVERSGIGSGEERKGSGSGSEADTANSTITPGASGPPADRSEDEPDDTPEARQARKAFLHDTLKDAGLGDLIPSNGRGVSKGKIPEGPGLTIEQKRSLALIQGQVIAGTITVDDAALQLEADGFSDDQINQAEHLLAAAGKG